MKKILLIIGACASLHSLASDSRCNSPHDRSDTPDTRCSTPSTQPSFSRNSSQSNKLNDFVPDKTQLDSERNDRKNLVILNHKYSQEHEKSPTVKRRNHESKEVEYKPRYETWLSAQARTSASDVAKWGLGALCCGVSATYLLAHGSVSEAVAPLTAAYLCFDKTRGQFERYQGAISVLSDRNKATPQEDTWFGTIQEQAEQAKAIWKKEQDLKKA